MSVPYLPFTVVRPAPVGPTRNFLPVLRHVSANIRPHSAVSLANERDPIRRIAALFAESNHAEAFTLYTAVSSEFSSTLTSSTLASLLKSCAIPAVTAATIYRTHRLPISVYKHLASSSGDRSGIAAKLHVDFVAAVDRELVDGIGNRSRNPGAAARASDEGGGFVDAAVVSALSPRSRDAFASLMRAHATSGLMPCSHVYSLFEEFSSHPLRKPLSLNGPSIGLFLELILSLGALRRVDGAAEAYQFVRTHWQAHPTEIPVALHNAMMNAYVEHYNIDAALRIYSAMLRGSLCRPNALSFEIVARGLQMAGDKRAFWRLLEEMRVAGAAPCDLSPTARRFAANALQEGTLRWDYRWQRWSEDIVKNELNIYATDPSARVETTPIPLHPENYLQELDPAKKVGARSAAIDWVQDESVKTFEHASTYAYKHDCMIFHFAASTIFPSLIMFPPNYISVGHRDGASEVVQQSNVPVSSLSEALLRRDSEQPYTDPHRQHRDVYKPSPTEDPTVEEE